jgi:hypothetical protein
MSPSRAPRGAGVAVATPCALLTLLLAAACPGPAACEEGLALDDEGQCVPTLPADCEARGLAVLGEAGCLAVGWTDCGEAFTKTDNGCIDACTDSAASCRAAGVLACAEGFVEASPGCAPVIANEPCTGATRATLGANTCVPIGACDAPFPPANATVFVDPTFPDEELDATHHRTLAAALASGGDVIAIEAGTYPEALVLPRPVALVGRCAAQVVIAGPGNPGLKIVGHKGVVLEGLTLRGFDIGIEAERGAEVLLEGVLLEDNQTVGMFVLDDDTKVTLRRSAIRDTRPDGGRFGIAIGVGFGGSLLVEDSALSGSHDMGVLVSDEGSSATLLKSAVLATSGRPGGALGWGLSITAGAEAELVDSLVRQNRNAGINVVGAGASLRLQSSVVDQTAIGNDAAGQQIGVGISAQLGSSLSLLDSTLRDNAIFGLRVAEPGTTAEVRGLVVDGVRPAENELSVGVQVARGAEVRLDESFLHNPEAVGGPLSLGLLAQNGSLVHLHDVTIASAGASGLNVDGPGARVQAVRVLVRDTQSSGPDFGYGISVQRDAVFEADGLGLLRNRSTALFVEAATASLSRASLTSTRASERGRGRGVSAQFGATLLLEECLLEDNIQAGVFLYGRGTSAVLSRSAVRGTRRDPAGQHGNGVTVLDDAVVRVQRSELSANEGVAAIFAQAAGAVERSRVLDNRVGLHAQDGASILEQAEIPAEFPALSVVVAGSEFRGNETRVGSGAVPLPQPAPSPTFE